MFSKKKATPLEVAKALLNFGPGSGESARESAVSVMKARAGIDLKRVLCEIFYLRVFTVDFAVSMALGNSSAKHEVLDVYYAFLEEMSKESISGATVFKKELKNRLLTYTEAVKTPHQNGPTWTVGKAFSDLCGGGMNAAVIVSGSIIFGTAYKAVSDFIKSIKIVG